jgi:hypothetical protein
MIEREKGNEYESYPDYLDLRDRNRSFDSLAAYTVDQAGLAACANLGSLFCRTVRLIVPEKLLFGSRWSEAHTHSVDTIH